VSNRVFHALVMLFVISALVACSGSDGGSEQSNLVASPQFSEADITSGCWTASERDRQVGGDESVAGQMQWKEPPAMVVDPAKTYTATLETSAGSVEVEFFPQDAPQTVNNFVCLGKAGYYDGTPFHRIIKGFVIQGGDPTGTGTGGPGYRFNDEPVVKDYVKGTLAMANAGPNTNGSQFFIVIDDLRGRLPKNYTIFGQVTGGMDVVDRLATTQVTRNESGEVSKPVEPVTLNKVTIHDPE
jgi:cyclophilin family peptidyl-prolyl cis-trans isomerase